MNKFLAIFVGVTCLVARIHAQTTTIRIDAGLLENATGTAPVANGMLLQILASPSGTFSAPNNGSYVTGDNVLLGNFVMNSNGGQAGETLTNDTFTLSTFNLTAGEPLLLRFYPDLSGTTIPTVPTLGTTYGQVRSSTIESGIDDGSQAPWVVPASGATVDLLYITVSAGGGGTYSNASAFASNIVGAAVPEPSTYTLGALGIVTMIGLVRMRRLV